MPTRTFVLCSSWEYWQRREAVAVGQHSWVIGFGRWIINFPISTFCLTAATLPQRKRRRPGWAACAAKAPGIPLELGMGWVVVLGCPGVHEPGAVPSSPCRRNLLLLAGKSAKHAASSQVKDATASQPAPGWFMAAACHEQGLGAALPVLGREGALCYFFPFFIQTSGWLLQVEGEGKKAVLCLCPPCRGVCRKDRSYTLQSTVC